MKKLRLGVIGCGEITRFMLLMAKLNRNVIIAGCADINTEKAGKYAAYFRGAKAYGDYKDMLHSADIDAVYIALPHNLHYPIIKELINRGIHIFCEKPITANMEDAREITALAREHKVKLGINYQYRYDKACYRMVRAAQNGDLGRLYYGICNIPWCRDESYFTKSKWHRYREEAGGGTLITQGSHGLDILLWAFEAKPVSALGVTRRAKFTDVEVEDLCMGTVGLEDGSLLQINSSMIANPEQPLTITIYGSKGTAVYTGRQFSSGVKFSGVKVPHYKPGTAGIHALARNLEAFRKWVLSDAPYHNKAEDAIPVLAAIMAIYRSAETKQSEKIEL